MRKGSTLLLWQLTCKELTKGVSMLPRVSGVYAIINQVNMHQYIGSSKNVRQRWQTHLSKLRKGKNESIILQNAWNKYGEQAFICILLEEVREVTRLIAIEQRYIDERKPEYNARIVAHSRLGMKNRPESVEKMRKALTGLKRTPEQRRRIGDGLRGLRRTPESIERIRKAATNPSVIIRQKMSSAKKGVQPRKAIEASQRARTGVPRTSQTKERISLTKKESHRLRREQHIPLDARRDEKGRFQNKNM